MDPVHVPSTLSAYNNILKKESKDSIIVNPSVWLFSFVPFLAFLVPALYMWSFDRGDGRISCLPSRSLGAEHLNARCFFESFTIPNLATYEHFLNIIHNGVGRIADKSIIKNRWEFKFLNISLLLSAILFLLPMIVWRHLFSNRSIFDAVGPLQDQEIYRSRDYRAEISRRLQFIHSALSIHMEQRLKLYVKILMSKLCPLVINFIVVLMYFSLFGWDIIMYFPKLFVFSNNTIHGIAIEERLFPNYVCCRLAWVGPSGTTEIAETTCLVASSSIYASIFAVLWVTLVIHMVSCVWALCTDIVIWIPRVRVVLLSKVLVPRLYSQAQHLALISDPPAFSLIMLLVLNLHPAVTQELLPLIISIITTSKQSNTHRHSRMTFSCFQKPTK